MRYLKLFENFIQSGGDTQAAPQPTPTPIQKPGWAPPLPTEKPGQRFEFENTSIYKKVLEIVERDSQLSDYIGELSNYLNSRYQQEDILELFEDTKLLSGYLESQYYKMNEIKINPSDFAKDALIYIASIGAMSAFVKLFYMLGNFTFQQLDQAGFSSVAGGVLLILIYLAFFNKVKKVKSNDSEPPMLEKRTKKEGEETLRSTSFAYVPDKDKSSTWKLRIDDSTHTKAAVAALGKGFRGNKVVIPSEERTSVIRKVRAAYKKFYPEIVKEEGYPKALEL